MTRWSVFVFFSVILLAWVGLHVYVFWRAASVPLIARHLPRWVLIAAPIFMATLFFVARIVEHLHAGVLGRTLEWIGTTWIGVLFVFAVCMFAADLATGFGFLLPRVAPSVRGWALVVGVLLSAFAFVQGMRAPEVSRYDVRLANLPPQLDGTVIVAVSDTHIGPDLDGQWLAARIAQIQAERPDLVVLAGDIIEGDGQDSLAAELHHLSAPMGVWAVTGNHEFYAGVARSVPLLQSAGVNVLQDRWQEVRPGLVIAGVDDLTSRRRRGAIEGFVDRALAGRPPGVATVYVSHTPWLAERAAADGAGLMLSGHTHKGQIWPFGYIVRLIYPLFAGRYEVNGMPVIVCRGTGTWGPRMRLWERGEILRITLRAQ